MSARKSVSYSFPAEDLQTIKNKMLNWLRPFSIFAYLDNNLYGHGPQRYELLAGAAPVAFFDDITAGAGDWLFGHLAYDYKNQVEPKLSSQHTEQTGFGDMLFFCPDIVISIPYGEHTLEITTLETAPDVVLEQLLNTASVIENTTASPSVTQWQYRFSKEDYLTGIDHIRRHIEEGDCYELNFCTEAFALQQDIDPFHVFHRLNTINPAPFAALYRKEHSWLMCASPERFLYREQEQVVSQPIKGTAGRGMNTQQDEEKKKQLHNDPKERAENVMIVDLVRNDLARSCRPGTVTVPELFGVYTFPQVHQLISTVEGTLKAGTVNRTIIENAFPMGSMTGAPKVRVMQLIEQYERSRRGLYSGTVGYIRPDGNFDFNVVIRSLLYNAATKYLSYQTGGAITYESNAASEWEEVRLKAKAMEQIFL